MVYQINMALQTIIHTSRPSRYNVAAITKSEYGQNVAQLVHSNTVSPALRGTVKRGKHLSNNTGTTHYDSQGILGRSKDSHNEVIMTSLQGQ